MEAQTARYVQQAKAEEHEEVHDAVGEIADAVDYETDEHFAANADQRADRIRVRTAKRTNEAELP